MPWPQVVVVGTLVLAAHVVGLMSLSIGMRLTKPGSLMGSVKPQRAADSVFEVSIVPHRASMDVAAPATSKGADVYALPPPPRFGDELGALGDDRDGVIYVPRNWLDVVPQPTQEVHIEFPDVKGLVKLDVDVYLFIDGLGRVRHLDVDMPQASPEFRDAVTQAFRHTLFTPGEIGGVPVPTKLHLKVAFRS